MMGFVESFDSIASSQLVFQLGWLLVHSVWQIGLIGLLAAVALLGLRSYEAKIRYCCLVALLALVTIAPVSTFLSSGYGATVGWSQIDLSGTDGAEKTATTQASAERTLALVQEPTAVTSPDRSGSMLTSNRLSQVQVNAGDAIELTWSEFYSRTTLVVESYFYLLVFGWLFGAMAFAVRPVFGFWTTFRLRRVGLSPCSDSIQQSFQCIASRMEVRGARVFDSVSAQVPMVVGYARPIVLLPLSVATNLTPSELESILAHELAHIKRHDFLVNVVQTMVETVFFYHPVVWWLSHRIRAERENCCDDMAVSVTGDRLQFSRALLAVEELRAASLVLAMQSNGSSLLARVRRVLAQVPGNNRHRTYRNSLVGIMGAVASTCLVALFAWTIVGVATAEDDVDQWGEESMGIVCRIVPVPVDTAEDEESLWKVDLSQPVRTFARPRDVAFVAELKNASDKSITLIGANHGFADNRPASNHYGPHLFEFQFTNVQTGVVPRTRRAFAASTHSHIVCSASTHGLAPGESLRVLLRPTQFERSMAYELGAGKFTATVQYRGPSNEVKETRFGKELRGILEERLRDEKQRERFRSLVEAWEHTVGSNEVAFGIIEDDVYANPKLVWGDEKDGLRAAVEIRAGEHDGVPTSAPGVLVDAGLHSIFHVKNVGEKPITFVSEAGRQGDELRVTNSRGTKIDVPGAFYTGWPIDVRWHLQPGDVAKLDVLTPLLNGLDQPGEYGVQYQIRFRSRVQHDDDGKQVFPAPGDWQSEIDTGITPVFLRSKPDVISPNGEIRGTLVDHETGKPIRGAIVACGVLRTDKTRGGGATCKTDSEGNYRLKPPGPGIYTVWLKKHPRSQRATAVADDGILVREGKISSSELHSLGGRYVHGTVTDQDGKPVQYLVVRCHSSARPQQISTQSVRTKQDGGFAFYVPPGRTYLYTSGGDGGYAHTTVDVAAKGTSESVSLKLAPARSPIGSTDWIRETTPGSKVLRQKVADDVTGTVVDQPNHPIQDAKVFIHGKAGVATDKDGKFRVPSSTGLSRGTCVRNTSCWIGAQSGRDRRFNCSFPRSKSC